MSTYDPDALEVQVGTVLIVRSRPLKPTTAVRLLLKYAMQMRLLRADLERDLKDLAPGVSNGADAFNRKDSLQMEFVSSAMRLKRVALKQLYVPSSEGQVRAVLAGWGVSVVPELQVREHLRSGRLVNMAPDHTLPLALDTVTPSSAG